MKTFDEYQEAANRTVIPEHAEQTTAFTLGPLGLCGEAGEVADLLKKHMFHGHGLDPEKLKRELGDVLWYINLLCRVGGFSMAEVAQANIDKLRVRYPEGFSSEASRNRKD